MEARRLEGERGVCHVLDWFALSITVIHCAQQAMLQESDSLTPRHQITQTTTNTKRHHLTQYLTGSE